MDISCLDVARTFGDALVTAMDAAKMKPVELSRRTRIDQSNISGLVNRRYPPNMPTVRRLAEGLGCNVWDLLDDVMTKWELPLTRHKVAHAKESPPSGAKPARGRSARLG